MQTEQDQVKYLMSHSQQETPAQPAIPSKAVRVGRLKWLAEELCELANAWGIEFDLNNTGGTTDNFTAWPAPKPLFKEDSVEAIVEAYDASLDLIVFAIGNGVAMGTDLQPGWDEVHRSNLSKFTDGWMRVREDGKWIKGPNYSPPQLKGIIQQQLDVAKAKDKQLLLESQPPT
jgi:predicted HAD superfamily Cof-like phosphohydrolase